MDNLSKFLPEDDDAYEPRQSKPESDPNFLIYLVIAIIIIVIIGSTFG